MDPFQPQHGMIVTNSAEPARFTVFMELLLRINILLALFCINNCFAYLLYCPGKLAERSVMMETF